MESIIIFYIKKKKKSEYIHAIVEKLIFKRPVLILQTNVYVALAS